MLAENTKSNFTVFGRLNADLAGPHFDCSIVRDETAPEKIADGAMELRAAVQMNLHPSLRQFSSAVQFCFRDGCMSMAGVLPSFFLKQLTQETIRSLEGVNRIDNRICVESSYEPVLDSKLVNSDSLEPLRLRPR
jgi:hypothetical protein